MTVIATPSTKSAMALSHSPAHIAPSPTPLTTKIAKLIATYAIPTILLLYFYLVLLPFAGFDPSEVILAGEASEAKEKPIIYTFHSKAIFDENMNNNLRGDALKDLYNCWRKQWAEAGWKPVILNEDDAMSHPDYAKFMNATMALHEDHYDRFCMNRWLAMANVGGGWFVEYSTFPLRMNVDAEEFVPTLPRRCTSYDTSVSQGQLPSLMSGNRYQWQRMANALAHYLEMDSTGETFNYMKVFLDFQPEEGGSVEEIKVLDGVTSVISTLPNHDEATGDVVSVELDCQHYDSSIAIHFPQRAIDDAIATGWIEKDDRAQSRAWYIRRFFKEFYERCGDRKGTFSMFQS